MCQLFKSVRHHKDIYPMWLCCIFGEVGRGYEGLFGFCASIVSYGVDWKANGVKLLTFYA